MRYERTASRNTNPALLRNGILFLSGFATSLRVERGHLLVRSGAGREIWEARLPRVSRPRLRRVVVYGKGGYTTWDALEWIDGVGASFLQLSRDGRVISTSAQAGPNQPALRRAQVAAYGSDVGLEIVRRLMDAKVAGQLSVLQELHDEVTPARSAVSACLDVLRQAQTLEQILAQEAKAAAAYWDAWRDLPIQFARSDERHLPAHWRAFGERQSPLSTSARKASSPAGAMLNYLYALGEFECRMALLAVGLDPGLGWAHRDASYRASAALDLLEALRPDIDRFLFQLLSTRTFSRREFVELPSGQVRLMPQLAKSIAETCMTTLEVRAGSFASEIARAIARSSGRNIRVQTITTRGRRTATLGRGTTKMTRATRPVANACRECGVVLTNTDRAYCEDCLPEFKQERTDKLVGAARTTLAQMRASERDPAKTPEAIAKRVAKVGQRKEDSRLWESDNPGPYDREGFRTEILPGLRLVTLPMMMRATGLTSGYCWQIRKGRRVPHPMYWEALRSVIAHD